ncbi:uncharacterized protein EAF02_004011 [Botrytis sinoallii]|uniref:uncharacterized protein n=1 Tax=Botrytis sinoallii TaxID=1463999 RepID=UPI0018FF7064|nr:uncharacterized protein EAF02_004011 [Botrytis sinoallii]KAF7885502.1 hypothetical protein EAF02_004011 [Botrytis sinoallii]
MSMPPPKTDKDFTHDERIIINLWSDYLKTEFKKSWHYQANAEDDVVEEISRLVGGDLNTSAKISFAYKKIPRGPKLPDSDRIFIVNKARRFFHKCFKEGKGLALDPVASEKLVDEIAVECGTRLDICDIGYHYLKYKKRSYADYLVLEWAVHWNTEYETDWMREDAGKRVESTLRHFFKNATSEQVIKDHYMERRGDDEIKFPSKPKETLEERRRAASSGSRYPR